MIMDNPGVKTLGDAALAAINGATAETVITAAPDSQGETQAYLTGLEGLLAASVSFNFNYGSGGGTLKAILETTINQGATWIEIARVAFTTSSAEKVVNLSGLTPVTTVYAPVALSDDTVKDGILGDRLRVSILKASTDYAGNTSLAVRLNPR